MTTSTVPQHVPAAPVRRSHRALGLAIAASAALVLAACDPPSSPPGESSPPGDASPPSEVSPPAEMSPPSDVSPPTEVVAPDPEPAEDDEEPAPGPADGDAATAPPPEEPADAGAPPTSFDTTTSGPEQILTGDYASYVWTSDQFQGSWTRMVAGAHDRYLVTLDQTAGGFDTDVVRDGHPVERVDELSPGLTVSATIDVRLQTRGDGMWWAGPKFTVHDETSFTGFAGDYENYVVENASLPPEEFAQRMFGSAQYLGETEVDGAVYRHYLSQHSSGWEQYWAVRQDYRTSGEVSVVPHLQTWRDAGMANEYVLIQKPANIETYGAVSGEVDISSPTYAP